MSEALPSVDFDALAAQRDFARRVAQALVRDEHLAEDLAHDALLDSIASRTAAPRSPRAWIARVVRNRALRWRRREDLRRAREHAAARPESAEERSARDLELQQAVLDALRALEPHFRTVIHLRYYEDRGPSRIAEELGLPVATVKTHLQRGLVRLRRELDGKHGGSRRAWLLPLTLFAGGPSMLGGSLVSSSTLSFALAGAWTMKKLSITVAVLLALFCGLWIARPDGESDTSVPSLIEGPVAAETSISRGEDAPALVRSEVAIPTRDTAPAASLATTSTSPQPVLRGRCVAAESGLALAGCSVALAGRAMNEQIAAMHNGSPWIPPTEIVTSDDGAFELRFDPPVGWEVRFAARHSDRLTRTATWDIDVATPSSSRELGDVAMVRGYRVSGRVVDEEDLAVRDAAVWVLGLPMQLPVERHRERAGASAGASNGDGAFELEHPVPAGSWKLEVRGRGLTLVEPTSIDVREAFGIEPLLVRVQRRELARIEGIVVDESGAGVAQVRLVATSLANGAHGGSGTTRADGRFAIHAAGPSEGLVRLDVAPPRGYERPFVEPSPTAWGSSDLRIVLTPELEIKLHVIERGSGAPVEDFAVSSYAHGSTRLDGLALRQSGHHPGGLLHVKGIERGQNVLYVHPRSHEFLRSEPVEFEALVAPLAELRVEVERLRALPVRVVDGGGAPIGGATVEVISLGLEELALRGPVFDRFLHVWLPGLPRNELLSRSETDTSGRVLAGAPSTLARVAVRVDHPSYSPRIVGGAEISGGEEVLVRLTRGGALHGRILLGRIDAKTLRCEVFLEDQRHHSVRRSERRPRIASDGTFIVEGLPSGLYSAALGRISRFEMLPGGGGDTVTPLEAHVPTVLVVEGDANASELVIDLRGRSPARLRARALLDGGLETQGRILLFGSEGSRHGPYAPDGEGWCDVADLAPGTYAAMLRIETGDREYEGEDELTLAAGAEQHADLHFVHRRASVLVLECDGATPAVGRELVVQSQHLLRKVRTDAAGRFALEPAPATPIRLHTALANGLPGDVLATFSVPREGREHELRVVLPASAGR